MNAYDIQIGLLVLFAGVLLLALVARSFCKGSLSRDVWRFIRNGALCGVCAVGIILTQTIGDQSLSSETRERLHQLELAQTKYYQRHGRYATTLTDLRVFDSRLNDHPQYDQVFMEAAVNGQGFYAELSSTNSADEEIQFTLTAERGAIISRTCQAAESEQCFDGVWRSEKR